VPNQQFFYGCFDIARRIFGQRDIAIVDDEDHAHFFVGEILGALKEGIALIVRHYCGWSIMTAFELFSRSSSIQTPLNGEANGNVGTLAIVLKLLSIVYHGRSQLYT
jgi:hypothetical protein